MRTLQAVSPTQLAPTKRHVERELLRRKRQKSDHPSAFDRPRQRSLMTGASSALTARKDLPAIRDESTDSRHVFVVDDIDFIDAKGANFALRLSRLCGSSHGDELPAGPTAHPSRDRADGSSWGVAVRARLLVRERIVVVAPEVVHRRRVRTGRAGGRRSRA